MLHLQKGTMLLVRSGDFCIKQRMNIWICTKRLQDSVVEGNTWHQAIQDFGFDIVRHPNRSLPRNSFRSDANPIRCEVRASPKSQFCNSDSCADANSKSHPNGILGTAPVEGGNAWILHLWLIDRTSANLGSLPLPQLPCDCFDAELCSIAKLQASDRFVSTSRKAKCLFP